MDYTITIPDELTPGIIAIGYAESKTPEEVVSSYAVAAATKACQDLKVGPFYVGPIPPEFNADGTPYVAPVIEDEPAVVDNDTTEPDGGDV